MPPITKENVIITLVACTKLNPEAIKGIATNPLNIFIVWVISGIPCGNCKKSVKYGFVWRLVKDSLTHQIFQTFWKPSPLSKKKPFENPANQWGLKIKKNTKYANAGKINHLHVLCTNGVAKKVRKRLINVVGAVCCFCGVRFLVAITQEYTLV